MKFSKIKRIETYFIYTFGGEEFICWVKKNMENLTSPKNSQHSLYFWSNIGSRFKNIKQGSWCKAYFCQVQTHTYSDTKKKVLIPHHTQIGLSSCNCSHTDYILHTHTNTHKKSTSKSLCKCEMWWQVFVACIMTVQSTTVVATQDQAALPPSNSQPAHIDGRQVLFQDLESTIPHVGHTGGICVPGYTLARWDILGSETA